MRQRFLNAISGDCEPLSGYLRDRLDWSAGLMVDEDTRVAAALRARAARIRAAAQALADRAGELPPSDQQGFLRLQAGMLSEGAARLDDQALEIEPVAGRG